MDGGGRWIVWAVAAMGRRTVVDSPELDYGSEGRPGMRTALRSVSSAASWANDVACHAMLGGAGWRRPAIQSHQLASVASSCRFVRG